MNAMKTNCTAYKPDLEVEPDLEDEPDLEYKPDLEVDEGYWREALGFIQNRRHLSHIYTHSHTILIPHTHTHFTFHASTHLHTYTHTFHVCDAYIFGNDTQQHTTQNNIQ